MRQVYLDWAATAPLCEEAAEAMRPYLEPGMANIAHNANANSLPYARQDCVQRARESARVRCAVRRGASGRRDHVYVGSDRGGQRRAFSASWRHAPRNARLQGRKGFVPHVVTTGFEHDAVLVAARELKARGCEVTVVNPAARRFCGRKRTCAQRFARNTVLVSVMAANNEIGTIQPVRELAALAHEAGALFHTDMVQLLGKAPVDLEESGVDAASFSAHKVCGPKGVGALYLRSSHAFRGVGARRGDRSQAAGRAPRTCAGLSASLPRAPQRAARSIPSPERERALRDRLYRELEKRSGVHASIPVRRGACAISRTSSTCSWTDSKAKTLILRLDMKGVCAFRAGRPARSSHDLGPQSRAARARRGRRRGHSGRCASRWGGTHRRLTSTSSLQRSTRRFAGSRPCFAARFLT